MRQLDTSAWQIEHSGDVVMLDYFDMVPDLPAPLDDLATLRRKMAASYADAGCLIEADVVTVDSVPALYQLLKIPLPDRPSGQVFIASFIFPKANCSAVLKIQAPERGVTGIRESTVMAQVGAGEYFRPHPYAPEMTGRLPWHVADLPRWDAQFADHPLSRARAWARHTVATAKVDPKFASLPPFRLDPAPTTPKQAEQAPVKQPQPPAEAGDVLETVLPGLPVAGFLPLWHDSGSVSYWRMTDPAAVLARLGAGVESRSEVDTNRYREAALLNPAAHTLMLMDRYRDEQGKIGGTSTRLVPATPQEARRAASDAKAIDALFRWIGAVALATAKRGEFLAVEAGGWQVLASPHVLIMLRPSGKGLHSVVETSPVPVGAPVWRDAQPVEGDTQILDAPVSDEAVRASGQLTRYAIRTWGTHPFELGLSFGANPFVNRPAGSARAPARPAR